MIRFGLLGASGKMGRLVRSQLKAGITPDLELVYTPNRTTADEIPDESLDVVLDYSSPTFVLETIARFETTGVKTRWLVGSTGWSHAELGRLNELARTQLIVRAPNFSLGVLLLRRALKAVERELRETGFAASMKEIHHTRKKDAPSGTAIHLREAMPAFPDFPIESVREGDVTGFHEVTFETARERLVFTHDAKDRALFADGALECVKRFAEWPFDRVGTVHSVDELL